MKRKNNKVVTLLLLFACFMLCNVIFAQVFTVINGSMTGSGTTISGWDGTAVSGRENGVYPPGTVTFAHQTPNSPLDDAVAPGSGSIVITAGQTSMSFYQYLGITAQGQTVSIWADIAWDGDWDRLHFGFYEGDPTYDVYAALGSVEIVAAGTVPADTDGTLDTFRTVSIVNYVLPNNPTRNVAVWFGTACTPYGSGAKHTTSKFAVDHVRASITKVDNWNLY